VVYDWVHRFNESGFTTFEQVSNPKGRPPILRAEQLRELVEVALSNPQERGLPFSNWSVPKLADFCRAKHLLTAVTDEWIRRLLRREGLTAQRIRTWKTSNDPHFDRKKTDLQTLSPLSAGGCYTVLRRMGSVGGPPHGRRGLGATAPTGAHARYLSSAARRRALFGFL
jgi:transposase